MEQDRRITHLRKDPKPCPNRLGLCDRIPKYLDEFGGAEGNRTPDLYVANVALSQLSYGPTDAGNDQRARRNM